MVEEEKSNQVQLYASNGKKLITKNLVMQTAHQIQFSTKSEIKDSCRGPGLLPPSPEIGLSVGKKKTMDSRQIY